MKYLQLFIILVVAAVLSSCATILTGTTQRVTIDSTPKGADIIIDGRMMGTTPAIVRLDRDFNTFIDDGKDINLELPGYYSDGYYLGTDIEPMCILNVFCILGFAIDAATGAIMRYDSDYYNFRMIPIEGAPVQPSSQSTVAKDAGVSETGDDESGDSEDNYEKLMKLVDLYEEGMITEEEFETEKNKIFEKNRE
jgi:uncharacterized protein YceK